MRAVASVAVRSLAIHAFRALSLVALVASPACDDASSAGSSGSSTSGSGGAATTSSTGSWMPHADHTTPDAAFIPTVTGTCPTIAEGKLTFAPAGIQPRDVEIYAGPDAATDGPLVFFWHGAGGSPTEAKYAIGADAMAEIRAAGGIVAAPYHDTANQTLPWFLDLDDVRDDDLRVADEILACMIAQRGVDLRHVHSVGFSAGALHTVQFAARRSGYLASVVVYSGGQLFEPPIQDPKNYWSAMLFHGGPNDAVIVNFKNEQEKYHQWLTDHERFSFLCDHGKGHTVPNDGPPAAWQFLKDHPFGVNPEPYTDGLPASFPSYCAAP